MRRTIETDIFGLPTHSATINSKQKGSANERECARALELWVGQKFVRVPMSGGLRRVDTAKIVGDIIPDTLDPDFEWPWVVETKALKTISHQRILSNRSMLFSIWEQPHADSIRSGKMPMALLRSNGMPKGEYYFILEAKMGGMLISADVPILFSGSNHKFSLIGYLFSDVKRCLPYAKFARAIKRSKFVSASKIIVE